MADIIVEPSINLISASASISQTSRSSMVNSKRCSVASTTKSSLRHSNHLLIEMLQNITTELAAHRSILLDVQSRVSHLEHESVNNDPPLSALRALEGQRSKRNSRLAPPEGQAWWEACQNFARNSEEPMSAKEFLRTPRRFSGFDWKYGPAPSRGSHTPPATPPAVDEVPPLTPTSEEEGDQADVHTPTKHDITIKVDRQEVTPKATDIEGDIKEHTVEVDKKNMPPAPVLLPPPVGKPTPIIPEAPVAVQTLENPQRYYKGIKSASTYRALMKNTKSDKGKLEYNVGIEAFLTSKQNTTSSFISTKGLTSRVLKLDCRHRAYKSNGYVAHRLQDRLSQHFHVFLSVSTMAQGLSVCSCLLQSHCSESLSLVLCHLGLKIWIWLGVMMGPLTPNASRIHY